MKLLYVMLMLLGLVTGLLMLDLSEVRAGRDLATVGYVADHVVEANPETVDPALDGRIVHVSGLLTADSPVVDPDTGVTMPSLGLRRDVLMYQWQHEVAFHNSHHARLWAAVRIPQGPSLVDPKAPANPPMPFQSDVFEAPAPHLAGYQIGQALVQAALRFQPTPLATGMPPGTNMLYQGYDPTTPDIGDLRIWYMDSPYQQVSVIALQSDGRLVPIHFTGTGENLVLVHHGNLDAGAHIDAIVHGIVARRGQIRYQAFFAIAIGMFFAFMAFDPEMNQLKMFIAVPLCALLLEYSLLQLYMLVPEPTIELLLGWCGVAALVSVFVGHRIARLRNPVIPRWIHP